jgi:L-serine dehydratase
MRAAKAFLRELREQYLFDRIQRIRVDLFGSLALTGLGHGTDSATLMGLAGETPDQIDVSTISEKLNQIRTQQSVNLDGERPISFVEKTDFIFNRRVQLPLHPNGMRFTAFDTRAESAEPLYSMTYFSTGGGFIVREPDYGRQPIDPGPAVPFPFASARELLEIAQRTGMSLSQIGFENERTMRSDAEIHSGLQHLWAVMQECVARGLRNEGILPGGLGIERRAPSLYVSLNQSVVELTRDPMSILDWVDMYALAVNEENAAGGRVVTAPTNGAAGIIPAVLHYFQRFCAGANIEKIERFLLTAGLIGSLYKRNASISGAEVGCQGEVGVACSMAAGGLAEVMGGTSYQVEEAAEIGMEHNLGLTCDPIKGLVQIPCIERNAMGAVKAINACRLALRGDGKHVVSLDRVIRVMKRTGADMSTRYKETSRGGLAVNLSEC